MTKLEEIVSKISEKIGSFKDNYNPLYVKRAVMGGIALSTILLAAQLCSDKKQEEREAPPTVRTMVSQPSPPAPIYTPREPMHRVEPPQPIAAEPVLTHYTNPIQQFSNDQVLIYCANQGEKDYAIQKLRQNNNQRRKISFSKNKKTATMRDLENHLIKFSLVVSGERIPQVRGGYDIITLRGHVWDMQPLYASMKRSEAQKRTLLLGGCYSDQFISQMASPEQAVFSTMVKADGSMNTYLLLKIIENIPKSTNWNDLERKIENQSERARLEYIFPESREYLNQITPRARSRP